MLPATALTRCHRQAVVATHGGAPWPTPAVAGPLPLPAPVAAGSSSSLVGGMVDCATAILFWCMELSCAVAACKAADRYIRFIQERYMDILGKAMAPVLGPSAAAPPTKCMKTKAAAKGKAHANVMEEDDEVVEVEDPADAGLAKSKEGQGQA